MKKTNLRRINAKVSLVLIILLFAHLISGALMMMGVVSTKYLVLQRAVASLFMLALLVHIVIGIVLIIRTQKIKSKTKAPYQKANRMFWNRRDSGIIMIVFLVLHLSTFLVNDGAHDISNYFGIVRLVTSLVFLFFLAVHLITNIRPIFIAFGVEYTDARRKIVMTAIGLLTLLVMVSFIYYYVRWNIFMDFGGH